MSAGVAGDFDERWRKAAMDETVPIDATHRAPVGDADTDARPQHALPHIPLARLGGPVSDDIDLEPLRVLGEGGMGVVMLARQRSLGREVAVKMVHPDQMDASVVAVLLAEGRITGSLEHPGIVPIHALGRDTDGRAALVMKRVSGTVWREMVRDPVHPGWDAVSGDRLSFHLEVLRRVCEAVDFAHSRGVIHRDLKTENVMIGSFGEVYVLDWGIALRRTESGSTTRVVGTPAFMAPEMLTGEAREITPRTDVYLLGGMLHEVLTGACRHAGTNIYEVAFNAFRSEPVHYALTVPAELAALCNRATTADPAQRPESARAFRDALVTFESHRASERLLDAASERCAELQTLLDAGSGDHARAVGLYAECTFAYRQARAAWPDSPKAIEGQRATEVLMAHHEIARRDLDAAVAILATMDTVPDELTLAIETLRSERGAEALEIVRLHGLARDLDPAVASRERAIVAVVAAVLSGVIPLSLSELQRHEAVALSYPTAAGVTMAVTLGGAATVWWFRRALLSNRAARQLMAMPFVALGAVLACLAAGALRGESLGDVAVPALLVIGVMFGCAAIVHDRRLFAVSGLIVGAALVGAWDPRRVFDVVSLTGVLSGLGSALVFRTLARTEAG